MWSSASSNELRMSLPITAVGPLNVETNPILMVSAAKAGCASARTAAPASHKAVLILIPLLVIGPHAQPNELPRRGSRRSLRFGHLFFQMTCFVREIAGRRQA